MSQPPFTFGEENAPCNAAVCVTILASVTSKQVLLETLAGQLTFPDYFSPNWDSFEECLRDLSWLPVGRVKHADLPLVNDLKNARIYLTILADSVSTRAKSEDHPLSVSFPIDLRDQISWLLRSAQRQ